LIAKTWMAGTSLDKPGHDDAETATLTSAVVAL
jgi:hypothetical protein